MPKVVPLHHAGWLRTPVVVAGTLAARNRTELARDPFPTGSRKPYRDDCGCARCRVGDAQEAAVLATPLQDCFPNWRLITRAAHTEYVDRDNCTSEKEKACHPSSLFPPSIS